MNLTTHYELNMPETRDAVDITKLNENMVTLDAALEKTQIVTGTYTGDNTEFRTINIGFTPKALFVCTKHGTTGDAINHYNICGGCVLPNFPIVARIQDVCISIVNNGFTVASNDYKEVNSNLVGESPYRYIAWR